MGLSFQTPYILGEGPPKKGAKLGPPKGGVLLPGSKVNTEMSFEIQNCSTAAHFRINALQSNSPAASGETA